MQQSGNDIGPDVQQMQILAGALITAVLVLGVIALVIGGLPGQGNAQDPIVAYVMAGMAVIEIPAFFIVPRTALAGEGSPTQKYTGAMLLRYAFCEGACLANLIAYIIDGQWWSLAIVGFLLLVMLAMFPTRTRVRQWLEVQQMRQEENM